MTKEQAYWDDFVEKAKDSECLPNCDESTNPRAAGSNTRVWYNLKEIKDSPYDVVAERYPSWAQVPGCGHFCIIENITPDYIRILGSAWDLDPWFFVFFMLNTGTENNWATWWENCEGHHHHEKAVEAPRLSRPPSHSRSRASSVASDSGESARSRMTAAGESGLNPKVAGVSDRNTPPPFRVIRGEYLGPGEMEYNGWVERVRSVAKSSSAENKFSSTIRTSIAWYKLDNLTIFLVDTVPRTPNSLERVGIELQTASTAHPGGHRRAHILCGPEDPLTSPRQLLLEWFQNPARFSAFLKLHQNGGGHTTDWAVIGVAMYSWQRSLESIKSDLYHLSFREVQKPDMKLNDRLHRKREDLWRLKSAIAETNSVNPCWTVPGDDHGLQDDQARIYKHAVVEEWVFLRDLTYPLRFYEATLAEAQRVEDMLIQTFQILLSTITIQESQLGIQQSRRAALLTWLAFVYAPLSFLCGIFGMNVKEINGSPLSVWTVVVALVVVMLITLALFGAYKAWDRWKSRSTKQTMAWPKKWFKRGNAASEKDPSKLV